ncbi:MAG: toxin-antitoxin system HicB family antitoxin [Pirellulales bacterium]
MATKNQKILQEARRVAAQVTTWADLSNALYNPQDGLVTTAYPLPEDRSRFMETQEYHEIRQLLTQAMERTGLIEGASPAKSGKFVVRLPKSLHAALDREAAAEGVSLNQLVLTKLAVQLSQIAANS